MGKNGSEVREGAMRQFKNEDELLQFIKNNIPFLITPQSKRAKSRFVSPFTSKNAKEIVCKELAKSIYNS